MFVCPYCSAPIGALYAFGSPDSTVSCVGCGGKSRVHAPRFIASSIFVIGGVMLVLLAWFKVVPGYVAGALIAPVAALGYALHVVATQRFGRLTSARSQP